MMNLVKDLRIKTGAGMLDCKNALQESGGDMNKAVDILRKKGLAAAAKKATRMAKEGVLGFSQDPKGTTLALVEVNCETDFVAKTDDFQTFVRTLTELVVKEKPKDLDVLFSLKMGSAMVRDRLTDLVAKVGENLQLRRFVFWTRNGTEKLGSYIHAGNKIGVMVRFQNAESLTDTEAKDIAMHVAAMNPRFLGKADVPEDYLNKEKEISRETLKGEKKPAEILEKIIEGKVKKHLSEVCLEEQVFVKDPEGKKTVKDWLKTKSQNAVMKEFIRLEVGEELGN